MHIYMYVCVCVYVCVEAWLYIQIIVIDFLFFYFFPDYHKLSTSQKWPNHTSIYIAKKWRTIQKFSYTPKNPQSVKGKLQNDIYDLNSGPVQKCLVDDIKYILRCFPYELKEAEITTAIKKVEKFMIDEDFVEVDKILPRLTVYLKRKIYFDGQKWKKYSSS